MVTRKESSERIFLCWGQSPENHIGNDLQLIFTFVRGDGVQEDYHANVYGNKILATLILLTYYLTLTQTMLKLNLLKSVTKSKYQQFDWPSILYAQYHAIAIVAWKIRCFCPEII